MRRLLLWLKFPETSQKGGPAESDASPLVLYYYALLSSVSLGIFGFFFHNFVGDGSGAILYLPAIGLGAVAVALRHGLKPRIAAHVLIASGSIMAVYGASLMGGLSSPLAILLILAPITASLFLPTRDVTVWAFLVIAGFFWLNSLQPEKVDMFPTSKEATLLSLCFVTIVSLIFTSFFKQRLTLSNHALMRKQTHSQNLLRVVGHDVANPLAVLSACLTQLKMESESREGHQTVDPERLSKHIGRLERATSTIEEIIMHTKQLTAIESGLLKVDLEAVELSECVKNSVFGFQEKIQKKDLKVFFEAPGHSVKVLAERTTLVNQVLSNLISNAIKFTPEGGRIDIRIQQTSQQVSLSIADSGIGIPQELQSQIFNWGAETNRKGTAGEKGTGFGLPIVQSYIELYGAHISLHSKSLQSVESTPSETKESAETGTTFDIQFSRAS